MQDSELQAEYSISLNSSPCVDFLTGEMDRGDTQGDYGGLMGEMSTSYGDVKDPEMNIFDKPLGMDDFSIDIRSDLYQSLGAVGNGDDTNTGESDDGQDFDPIQNMKKTKGPKAKKMKFVKDSESVNNNLHDHSNSDDLSLGNIETSPNNREKKNSKNSQGGQQGVGKSRHSRKCSRPLKNSKNPQKQSGEATDSENSPCSVLANGSPEPTLSVSEGQGGEYIQIEEGFVGNNSERASIQNVIVRMEPTLNMHSDLSMNNVQAIRDEFSDLHADVSEIEVENVAFGSPDAVSGYLNSQTNNMASGDPHPSTSTDPVGSSSNILITSAPDLVTTAGTSSDKPIILNANVLNQGTEKNVSYVMIPVSLVQQFQAANQATTSTAGSPTAVVQRPQIVQLLNDNNGYVCHVCRYSGKMPYLLENHMKTCHLPHRPYICLGCYKAFNLRGTALCHIRLKHLEAGTQMMIDQDLEAQQTVECQKLMQMIFRCHVCDSVGKYMSGVNNKPKNLNPHLFVCKLHAAVTPSP